MTQVVTLNYTGVIWAEDGVQQCGTSVTIMETTPDPPEIVHCPVDVTLYQGETHHLHPPPVAPRDCSRALGCDFNPSDLTWNISDTGGPLLLQFVAHGRYPTEAIGDRSVLYAVMDSYGQSDSCQQTISVVSSLDVAGGINGRASVPLVCPADVTLPTDPGRDVASYTFPTPEFAPTNIAVTWTISIWHPSDSPPSFKPGDTATLELQAYSDLGNTPARVRYTFTDPFLVSTNCDQLIHVTDAELPVMLNCPLDRTVEIPPADYQICNSLGCGGRANLPISSGSFESYGGALQDNSGWGQLLAQCPSTSEFTHVENLEYSQLVGVGAAATCLLSTDHGAPKTYGVIWALRDTHGNRGVCTQRVTVIDVIAPVFYRTANSESHNTDPGEHFYRYTPLFPAWGDNNNDGDGSDGIS